MSRLLNSVRTVFGDIDAADLGIVYAHEHLVLDSPLIAAAFPHILLNDIEIAVQEVISCKNAGVQTMVDAMPCSAGRNAVRLAAISKRTGVNVIAATGLHHVRYYGLGHWTNQISATELAQLFIDDVNIGIDRFDYTGPYIRRTEHQAGIIKVATGGETLTKRDELLLEAASIAHNTTGAPILTHCEHGHGGVRQIEALTDYGVPADAILLSHIDKVVDIGYLRTLADMGAWLLLDQALRQHEMESPDTALLIAALAESDHLKQVVLGTDGARRDLWASYAGKPGLDWLVHTFPEKLREQGLSNELIELIYIDNPARALSLRIVP